MFTTSRNFESFKDSFTIEHKAPLTDKTAKEMQIYRTSGCTRRVRLVPLIMDPVEGPWSNVTRIAMFAVFAVCAQPYFAVVIFPRTTSLDSSCLGYRHRELFCETL